MNRKLEGRSVLVTGGSSGIGEAVSYKLAAHGATVAVLSGSDRARAQAVVDRIEGEGGRAHGFAADLQDIAAIERVAAQVRSRMGPIDALVNSAGVYLPSPAGDTRPEVFDRTLAINLRAPFFMIQAVLGDMRARGRGHIVNVASVAGLRGSAGYAAYSASKAGLIMLTRSLARELAPHGIAVNAIAPGNTETPLNAADRARTDVVAAKQAATPSGRVYSPPSEMAEAVLFLLAGDVRAMHGAVITLDEGLSA